MKKKLKRKIYIVSSFIDIIIARRTWNFKSIAYSTMQYAMFNVMKDIRNKTLTKLADILTKKLNEEEVTFAKNDRLRLHQQNRYYIHHLLAAHYRFYRNFIGNAQPVY